MDKRAYEVGKEITDEQWSRIAPHLSEWPAAQKGGQQPADKRACFEAVLWMARSGARWKDLPRHFPAASTVWKRLRQWEEDDSLKNAWRHFLTTLDPAGMLRWDECFADGTFFPAKKGANTSGKPSAAREQSLGWWPMARVFRWEFSPNLPRGTRSRS